MLRPHLTWAVSRDVVLQVCLVRPVSPLAVLVRCMAGVFRLNRFKANVNMFHRRTEVVEIYSTLNECGLNESFL